MSLKVGDLYGELDLRSDKFDKGINSHKGILGSLTGVAAKVALGIGAALVGAAVAGAVAFVGFEGQMNEVFTLLPDITDKAMGKMTDQVKDFAVEFGVLPNEVVPALYQAISAGVPKKNVFEFLETAQKAAVGGVTDLTTAVDGISSVVNAYGNKVTSATEASDLMFTAVRLGKTNFEQLSASLFNVVPVASSLGVKFGNVTAAIAAMTAQGTPTSVATTQLRQMLVELSKAGSATADVFEKVAGKSFPEFIASGGNLQEALQLLEKDAGGSGKRISDLFGSVEAGQAALALTGKGTQTFRDNLTAMGDSAGATEGAYARMETGIGRAFDKMKAAAMVLLINLGEQLAPALAAFADWVNANMPQIQATMAGVFKAIGLAVQGLVALIAPILEGIKTAWAALFGPAGSMQGDTQGLGVTIGAVWTQIQTTVAAGIEAVRAVIEKTVEIIRGIWEQFGEHLVSHLQTSLNNVLQIVQGAWDILKGIFEVITAVLTGDWKLLWQGIKHILSGAWDVMLGIVKQVINTISMAIGVAMAGIAAAWRTSWNAIKTFAADVWDVIKQVVKVGIRVVLAFITGGLSEVIPKIIAHWDDIKGVFSRAWERIKEGVANAVDKVVSFVKDMGARILGFLADLPGKLFSLGKDMIGQLVQGIASGLGPLWDLLESITNAITDAFDSNIDLGGIVKPQQIAVPVNPSRASLAAAVAGGGDVIVQRGAVVIDAKNVKDFNSVIDIFANISQAARQGVS